MNSSSILSVKRDETQRRRAKVPAPDEISSEMTLPTCKSKLRNTVEDISPNDNPDTRVKGLIRGKHHNLFWEPSTVAVISLQRQLHI